MAALAVLFALPGVLADIEDARPSPPTMAGNPLVAVASAVVRVILHLLGLIQRAMTFITLTLPTMIIGMLHYSFTISFGFPHLVGLFVIVLGVVFFLVRYKYLTKYTQLKETALPSPSPPTLTNSLPLVDTVINERKRSSNPLHSYLDEFLSAIRIFGYLEKPIFHELSRHLQTRRLAAGDTIEVGGGDFWCVVEGNVQVFAPSTEAGSSSPDPLNADSSFNGYNLVNEVSTGGTLSSLFSILSLFTEDVKLSWNSESVSPEGETSDDPPRTRANSDVSQLDGRAMGLSRMDASNSEVALEEDGIVPDTPSGTARVFESSSQCPPQIGSSPNSDDAQSPKSLPQSRTENSAPSPLTTSPLPASPSIEATPVITLRQFPSEPGKGGSGRETPEPRRPKQPKSHNPMKGIIARATVDTTLAVIPAEAFRKVTRKYPKATGTIVQVVLERFSRVTFMTAHKFFGLTREILRSEASLNSMVSYPLPRTFYTGGGMQILREKFEPSLRRSKDRKPDDVMRDYFSYVPTSPNTRNVSLPSSRLDTPSRRPRFGGSDSLSKRTSDSEETATGADEYHDTRSHNPRANFTPRRQQSAYRKEVAAGDLAVVHDDDDEDTFYRPIKTPGLPRIDTWRGRIPSISSNDIYSDAEADEVEEELQAELRSLLVECIAKSIGLLQPSDHALDSTHRSVSASSSPGSPMFLPSGRPASVRGPFGNVLDMINASPSGNDNISGLLRESLMNARMQAEDDQSSISASVQESSLFGGPPDVNSAIMRDLGNRLEVLRFKKGSTLVKQGERAPGLYYVIDGFLDVSISSKAALEADSSSTNLGSQPHPEPSSRGRPFSAGMGQTDPGSPVATFQTRDSSEEENLYTVNPGGLAGYLSSLCGTESYVKITAKTDCYVGFVPRQALERIIERRPLVLLTLSKRLLSLLSPLVLLIDAGLDWMQLAAGQILFEKGSKATDFYIVINGRLRSVVQKPESESVEVLREYSQDDSIGELDVITGANHPNTVQAIRETELVRIPAALFDAISTRHPATTVQFMRLIASRVRKGMSEQVLKHTHHYHGGELRADRNLKTVCILGVNKNVPVAQFATKLKASLEDMGEATSYLDQATVMRHLGRHAFSRMGALKIAGWLSDQEEQHRIVLYVADTQPSSQWTQTCIRQADLILVLGMGDDPSIGEYEKVLLAMKSYARKELVLLHDDRFVPRGSTRLWLKNRPFIQGHFHVELPGHITSTKSTKVHDPAGTAAFKHLRERVETRIKQYRGLRPLGRPRRPAHMNDFARIARRLVGKQVGLVLGGGGARGISHLGMLQALEEKGIPVDAIAGCSIGSFVGGLYAGATDLIETTGRVKQFSSRMGSMLRILSDVTYPHAAYTTGHEFNRGIYKAFYNTHIEDCWIPFFCNSTNITHSRMEIHRSGYAWRYVRASMTLAGLLPPLSDNGDLLVDGGYMDNTPIAPLRASGIQDVIVVDVGSIDDTSARNYGDSVSGWWLFINKFNPFYKTVVPSMTEISSRLTYVSSVRTLEDVKNDPKILYMAMPVQDVETIGGFKRFGDVRELGLHAARKQLKDWEDEGRLPHVIAERGHGSIGHQRNPRLRRSSI